MTGVKKRASKLSRQDIVSLFRSGKSFKSGLFWVKWDLKGSRGAQFCATTKKKCMRTAVERNRMRRLAKESFRKNRAQIKQGARIVLQLGGYADTTFEQFNQTFRKIFISAGLITDEKNINPAH